MVRYTALRHAMRSYVTLYHDMCFAAALSELEFDTRFGCPIYALIPGTAFKASSSHAKPRHPLLGTVTLPRVRTLRAR